MRIRRAAWALTACLCAFEPRVESAAAQSLSGRVTLAGEAVPGAVVVAARPPQDVRTTTSVDGEFHFDALAPGRWSLRVEMTGLVADPIDVEIPSSLPIVLAARIRAVSEIIAPRPADASPNPDRSPIAPVPPDVGLQTAADGFLISGSVMNAAASDLAQARSFGNGRPGGRSPYSGSLSLIGGSSGLDAAPHELLAKPVEKPSYADLRMQGAFSGPLRVPGLLKNGPNFFVTYQLVRQRDASVLAARVPTIAERQGDLSATVDASGRSAVIVDPRTGLPFLGNVIPADRLSPQARALLALYPQANAEGDSRNYQRAVISKQLAHDVQLRLTKPVGNRNLLSGTMAFKQRNVDLPTVLGLTATRTTPALDATINWNRQFRPGLSGRMRYQFNWSRETVRPSFSRQIDISGQAGIAGNDSSPENWGPPTLSFPDIANLTDAQYRRDAGIRQTVGAEIYLRRRRHTLTIGGDVGRATKRLESSLDGRGTLTFTGARSGTGLSDFLLGLPATSSIAYRAGARDIAAPSFDAYVSDDWRVGPSLTVTAGVRWEYDAPYVERENRLINIDMDAGFAAAAPVAPNAAGSVTGRVFSRALIDSDFRGVQPRLAASWRPMPGSSLVFRGGYGAYRNTRVYDVLAALMADQPPLAQTYRIESIAGAPLTLADPFPAKSGAAGNTFAVDPHLRVGVAHNMQLSVQRDLPASLTIAASYLATFGRHLIQASQPNTLPPGAADPCPTCPRGYIYVSSGADSVRHAGQFVVRRRLRHGFAAEINYTLSSARDNASTFNADASPADVLVAQDWRNLDAEYSPSAFDRRHVGSVQVQYTTAPRSGMWAAGRLGSALRNWTVAAQMNTASGPPATPVVFVAVPGSGRIGLRPDRVANSAPSDGRYADPASFAAPRPGQWGDAGRFSIRGPSSRTVDVALARGFVLRGRLTLDGRLDVTNALNGLNITALNLIVGSPQFGRPTGAGAGRKILLTFRLRN